MALGNGASVPAILACSNAMESRALDLIARLTTRERLLIAAGRGTVMDGAPDKLAALVDVVRVLQGLGVRHAVVGGVAVGVRSGAAGHARHRHRRWFDDPSQPR